MKPLSLVLLLLALFAGCMGSSDYDPSGPGFTLNIVNRTDLLLSGEYRNGGGNGSTGPLGASPWGSEGTAWGCDASIAPLDNWPHEVTFWKQDGTPFADGEYHVKCIGVHEYTIWIHPGGQLYFEEGKPGKQAPWD